jgi:hypothetical protein
MVDGSDAAATISAWSAAVQAVGSIAAIYAAGRFSHRDALSADVAAMESLKGVVRLGVDVVEKAESTILGKLESTIPGKPEDVARDLWVFPAVHFRDAEAQLAQVNAFDLGSTEAPTEVRKLRDAILNMEALVAQVREMQAGPGVEHKAKATELGDEARLVLVTVDGWLKARARRRKQWLWK